MKTKMYLLILLLSLLPVKKGFCQLQDPDNFIFLYMNGLASNQDLAKDAYIINSDGDILHQWDNSSITSPETAPGYLTPDGLFLRGIESPLAAGGDFSVGRWGTVQLVDYSGNVVWEYNSCTDNIECFHHDIELLPNGNILATAFHRYDETSAAQDFGWNVTGQGKLLIDVIYEIEPNLINGTSQIVWEWKWIDHVIQDGDPTLPNYGIIANNPEKIDLHFYDSGTPFLPILLGTHSHINSIDYNPTRDEILISSGTHDEIYVIDHSTTTAEAASSSGGNSGKGGDILYRWGNPQVYDFGGGSPATYSSWRWTKTQHDARWLLDGSGNITIHNNNSTTNASPSGLNAWSEFMEITVPYSGSGYSHTTGQPFGPSAPTIWADYDPLDPLFNCAFSGGGQKLDNGHIFTTSAAKFTLLEHDETGQIDWFFDLNDLKDPTDTPGGQVFKAEKYPMDYSGFDPLLATLEENVDADLNFNIYPNPANDHVIMEIEQGVNLTSLNIFDNSGRIVLHKEGTQLPSTLDVSNLQKGTYILQVKTSTNSTTTRKLVIN